jgi:hypothetical protein
MPDTPLAKHMYGHFPENMKGDCIDDDLYRVLAVLYTVDEFKRPTVLAGVEPYALMSKEEMRAELNKIGVFRLILGTEEGRETFDRLIDFFNGTFRRNSHARNGIRGE